MIEGTEMQVCRDCSRFGKVLGEIKFEQRKDKKQQRPNPPPDRAEIIQAINEDYPKMVKEGREKLNLTQKEFAQKINEKESLIHKIETGNFEPNLALARKLEKILNIKLVEQKELESSWSNEQKKDSFTIGDFIKIKKK